MATVVPMRTASTVTSAVSSGTPGQPQELTDAGDGGVGVAGRVVRQEFVREQPPVGTPRDDVREGAAPVDPELPASHVSLPLPRCSERPEAVDHVAQNTLVRQFRGGYGTCHVHQFLVDEIADEDPDHADGKVQFGRQFGDRLGAVTAEPDDVHVLRGQRPVRFRVAGAGLRDDDRDQIEAVLGRTAWCGRASWRTAAPRARRRRRTSVALCP